MPKGKRVYFERSLSKGLLVRSSGCFERRSPRPFRLGDEHIARVELYQEQLSVDQPRFKQHFPSCRLALKLIPTRYTWGTRQFYQRGKGHGVTVRLGCVCVNRSIKVGACHRRGIQVDGSAPCNYEFTVITYWGGSRFG